MFDFNNENCDKSIKNQEVQLITEFYEKSDLLNEISRLKALLSDAQAEVLRLQTMIETQLKISERN